MLTQAENDLPKSALGSSGWRDQLANESPSPWVHGSDYHRHCFCVTGHWMTKLSLQLPLFPWKLDADAVLFFFFLLLLLLSRVRTHTSDWLSQVLCPSYPIACSHRRLESKYFTFPGYRTKPRRTEFWTDVGQTCLMHTYLSQTLNIMLLVWNAI